MSKETAKKLLTELQTSEELQAKIRGITDPVELAKKAVEAGYDVTLEELIEAEKELRAGKIAARNKLPGFKPIISGGRMNYQDFNAKTIDSWIEDGWEWGQPISHEVYEKALHGEWDVSLTPLKPVPHEWFGELKGKKLLGLASGGGQQMPVFAALGAECTVLDYSEKQLESEKMVSDREGYPIRIIRADMTKPLPFEDEEFDIIFHPVSNCYAEDVRPIWKECFRILKRGGYLLSGTANCIDYIVDSDEKTIVNSLPFNPLKNPEHMKQLQDDDAGIQFSHSLEEQIGGQLEAGFRLLNLYEDTNNNGRMYEMGIPSYLATRSKKE